MAAFRDNGTASGIVIAAGPRRRASVGGILGTARGMVAAEGALLRQRGALDDVAGDVTTMGYVLRGVYVWNGRQLPTQEIVPASARGAFEAGVRVRALGVWGDGAATLLSSRSDRRSTSAGVALGWTPTRLTRTSMAYDVATTDRKRRVREHALMVRVQQAF